MSHPFTTRTERLTEVKHDFETQLRADLSHAAEAAPVFTGLEPTRRPRRSAAPPLILTAAIGIALAGDAWWITTSHEQPTDSASCPSILQFQGRIYHGHGEQVRVPRPGQILGTGTHPGCEGEKPYESEVRLLPGVVPTVAVVTLGGVWIADTADSLPAEIAALDEPVPCEGTGLTNLSGDWVAIQAPMPERDNDLTPPYVAVIKADHGRRLPLEKYAAVTVKVHINEQTVGGTDPALATDALRGSTPVMATVRCDGSVFIAEAISLLR